MTIQQRSHVGFEVVCDATGCTVTTASQAPRKYTRSPALALAAARLLWWLPVTIRGKERWVCPQHQVFDWRLGRWVARPLVTR